MILVKCEGNEFHSLADEMWKELNNLVEEQRGMSKTLTSPLAVRRGTWES